MKKKKIDLAFNQKDFNKILKKSRKGSVIIFDESQGSAGMSSLAMASASLYKPLPRILGHFGTCDMCGTRFKRVLHMNYDVQPERDFRACEICFRKIIKVGEGYFGTR